MKTSLECIPCLMRQTLEAVRFVTSDEKIQEKVLRNVLQTTAKMNFNASPPKIGQIIHRLIRELSRCHDPYRELKDHFNAYAWELYPMLETTVKKSSTPLETAARIAVAGNIIDFGAYTEINRKSVLETIERALAESPVGSESRFAEAVAAAETILYLGDNTGEIVFDRLLVQQLPKNRVTFAVRGMPVLNDATLEDAATAGLTELVPVIDNGSDAPGTILDECSEEFRKAFSKAGI